MKKFILSLMFGLSLLTAPAYAGIPDKNITIKDYMFAPAELSIPVGTKVTWTNLDDVPHTIVATKHEFHSSALDTKDTYAYTFAKPGVYKYFCTLHPQMVATITVTAAQ